MAGNYFDQFDPKPVPRGGVSPARGPAPGFSDTPALKGKQVQASTGQSVASTGLTNVNTQLGAARLPFASDVARATAQKLKAEADLSTSKMETTRGATKAATQNAVRQAEEVTFLINKILANPALPQVIGRNWNPAVGMTGHYALDKDSAVAGDPQFLFGGTQASDLVSDINKLKGMSFLQARIPLKGSGQISNVESKKAEQAYINLDPTQQPASFAQNLIRARDLARSQANTIVDVNREMQQRSLAKGIGSPSAFTEGQIAEDAQGNRAVFKGNKWVELP